MTWPPKPIPLGQQLDVVSVGEAMLLVQPPPPQDLVTAPVAAIDVAGAELTVCSTLARFGARAALLTRVGADPAGERILTKMRSLGVDDQLVTVDPGRRTGLFLRETSADGSRQVYYYRDSSAASALDDADAAQIPTRAAPRAVVLSGITASLGPGPRRLLATLTRRLAPLGSALVVDANLRDQLPGHQEGLRFIRHLLPEISLLALGQEESEALFGVYQPGEVLRAAAEAGVGETVLKAGADGSWLLQDGNLVHQPSTAASVVDPIGAGDAYLGAYLAARLNGQPSVVAAAVASDVAAQVIASPGDTTGLPGEEACSNLLYRNHR